MGDKDEDSDDNEPAPAIAIAGEDKPSKPKEVLDAIKAGDVRMSLALLSRLGLAEELVSSEQYMIISMPSHRRGEAGKNDVVMSSLYAMAGGNMGEKFGLMPAVRSQNHLSSESHSVQDSLWEIKCLGEVSIHYCITSVSSRRHLTVTPSDAQLVATDKIVSNSKTRGSPSRRKDVAGEAQRWQFERLGLGSYVIKHSMTERLLCSIGSSRGQQVVLSSKGEGKSGPGENPRWRIYDASEINWTTQWGETLLHRAAWKGLPEVVEAILARPDFTVINAQNQWGETALHGAVLHAHPEVCSLLLSSGLQIDHVDQNGWTALDVLETHASINPETYDEVVEVFQRHGVLPGQLNETLHPLDMSMLEVSQQQ